MAAGFPLAVVGRRIRTSEALYQACRFPHLPEMQEAVLHEASPMSAKMVSRSHESQTRSDWERIKVKVMGWCLGVKLAQHFDAFGRLLEATANLHIVEDSRRDAFWGAVRSQNGMLCGVNALGRLLMDLRRRYSSSERYRLLYVVPPPVPRFELLGQPIEPVDERGPFLRRVLRSWSDMPGLDTSDRLLRLSMEERSAAW